MSKVSSLSVFFFSYLANAVWEVAVDRRRRMAGGRLLKRLGPRLEHSVWVSTLIIAVVTPALPFLRALAASLISPNAAGPHPSIILVTSQGVPNSRPAFLLPEAVLWSLLAIYVVAILYFAARLDHIAAWHHSAAFARQSQPR